MKLQLDAYTKFILTLIAIALLLNAASPFVARAVDPHPVHASEGPMEVRITDIRSTWPYEIKVANWPSTFPNR